MLSTRPDERITRSGLERVVDRSNGRQLRINAVPSPHSCAPFAAEGARVERRNTRQPQGCPAHARRNAFVEVSNTSAAFDRGRKLRMYGAERVHQYPLLDLKHSRLTLFGKPNDLGYDDSRELGYGDTLSLAALPDVVFAADPFLDPRSML
jgi:hypothetical protein